ncbi:MAG: hypothetical protein ABR498_08220, partial [Candidatus Dormibacteria bacterium]
NVSNDGGKTWSSVILQADGLQGLNDKNWVVVDNGAGIGHHPGRVYVVWDKVLDSFAYSYCDPDVASSVVTGAGCDKAANWTSVHNNSWYTIATTAEAIGAWPVVLTDGSLGILYNARTQAGPCTNNPTDQSCFLALGQIAWTVIPAAGAAVWPAPLPSPQASATITPYDSNGVTDQRAGGLPQAAVDPKTDQVYVVWEDNRSRTDGGSSSSNQNDAVIVTAKPDASGIPGLAANAWSTVKVVNPGPENDFIDHYNTTVAVGEDGIVRVAYRQRDENPADGFNASTGRGTPIDTYYQESRDGGQTFSAPLKVDSVQGTTDAGYGAFDTTNITAGLFEGDYDQIAAGGNDQSYMTREEAYAGNDTSQARDFTSSELPSNSQWQQTWVAQIAPANTADTPESPLALGMLVVGAGGAAAIIGVRRRRQTN